MSSRPIISIELTEDEALVLHEWLTREDDAGSLPIAYAAEQTVLWRLQGELEQKLTKTFSPDYDKLLDAARSRVNDKG